MPVIQISKVIHCLGTSGELPDRLELGQIGLTTDTADVLIGAQGLPIVTGRKSYPYENLKILTELDVQKTLTGDVYHHGPLYSQDLITETGVMDVPLFKYDENISAKYGAYDYSFTSSQTSQIGKVMVALNGNTPHVTATANVWGLITDTTFQFSTLLVGDQVLLRVSWTPADLGDEIYKFHMAGREWVAVVPLTSGETPPPQPIPGTIINLVAAAMSPTTVQLSYTNAEGALAHEYRINGGVVAPVPTGKLVTGLTPKTTYSFEVRGLNANGNGPWSNIATATTPGTTQSYPDTFSVVQGKTLTVVAPGVLTNDVSTTGLPLTAELRQAPASGALTLNSNGSFIYTPNQTFSGTDTFKYRAYDGTTYGSDTTVTISVQANPVPVANTNSYTLNQGNTLAIAAPGVLGNDTDANGDPLTAQLVTGVVHGTLTFNADGSFSYTPTTTYTGTDTFTYRAYDGVTYSSPVTVTLTINSIEAPNQAPTAVAHSYSMTQGTTLTKTTPGVLAGCTDPDNDTLTAILVTGPSHGTLSLDPAGSFTYTPASTYFGGDSFVYKATDGNAFSNSATVTISIAQAAPANSAPVAANNSYTVAEDQTLSVAAPGVLGNDSDVDNNSLTASVVSLPTRGALTFHPNGSFTYVPNPNFNGTDKFTYKVYDGSLYSNVATVTLRVTSVADPDTFVGVSNRTVSNTNALASNTGSVWAMHTDGTVKYGFGSATTLAENWLSNTIDGSVNNPGAYEVMFTLSQSVGTTASTSGTSTLNSWLSLSAARTLKLVPTENELDTRTYTVQIRKVGTTTVLDSATITLSVDTSITSGGGGGGGGNSGCVAIGSILPGYASAGDVLVGDELMLGNPISHETRYGAVTYAAPEPQNCYRIETVRGVTLKCSDTAPIATSVGGIVKPAQSLGAIVPVQIDGEWFDDEIISVEPIGVKTVMKITCENDFFLAGEFEGKYFLHHNTLVHKV